MRLLIQFKRYRGSNPTTATDDKCTGGKWVLQRAFIFISWVEQALGTSVGLTARHPNSENLGFVKLRHFLCRSFNLSDSQGSQNYENLGLKNSDTISVGASVCPTKKRKMLWPLQICLFCSKNVGQSVKQSILNFYFINYLKILTFNQLKKQILDTAQFFLMFLHNLKGVLEEIALFRGLKVKISKYFIK